VFLERDGRVFDQGGETIEIPRFGGGDRAWDGIVACVEQHFAPFQIDVVTRRPVRGDFITAVVGGRASQLGLDDRTTNGVGPYAPGRVLRNAVVHVFSQVGTGERDIANLCAVTVHEVAHAMGLDHSYKCGDIMSYFLDRCGPRRLLDVEAPCGESRPRSCGDGTRSQNSYRKLAAAVGLRNPGPEPEPEPADLWEGDTDHQEPAIDSWGHDHPHPHDHSHPADDADADDDDHADDHADEPPAADPSLDRGWGYRGGQTLVRGRDGHVYAVEQVMGRRGQRWIVLRRVR
jgi:hypothetical protein